MGYGFAALAVIAYSVLAVLAKKGAVSLPPFHFIGLSMLVMALAALAVGRIAEPQVSPKDLPLSQIALLAMFALVNLAGFVFYLKALQTIPASHYQLIYGVTPVTVAVLAYVLLGEPLFWRYVPATLLICAGIWLAVRPAA